MQLKSILALTTVLASMASGVAQEEKAPTDKWRAWAVTQGGKPRLIVEGIVENGGPGKVALFRKAKLQESPKVLRLRLKIAELPGFWAAVVQPIPAKFVLNPCEPGAVQSIEIVYPNGAVKRLDAIVDAGRGPGTGKP